MVNFESFRCWHGYRPETDLMGGSGSGQRVDLTVHRPPGGFQMERSSPLRHPITGSPLLPGAGYVRYGFGSSLSARAMASALSTTLSIRPAPLVVPIGEIRSHAGSFQARGGRAPPGRRRKNRLVPCSNEKRDRRGLRSAGVPASPAPLHPFRERPFAKSIGHSNSAQPVSNQTEACLPSSCSGGRPGVAENHPV